MRQLSVLPSDMKRVIGLLGRCSIGVSSYLLRKIAPDHCSHNSDPVFIPSTLILTHAGCACCQTNSKIMKDLPERR